MSHLHHEPEPDHASRRRTPSRWWAAGLAGMTGLALTTVGVATPAAADGAVGHALAAPDDRPSADGHRDEGTGDGKSKGKKEIKPRGIPVPCDADALIAAITLANARDGAVLDLAEDCTYLLTAAIDSSGLPAITAPITLNGGKNTTIERAAAADPFRILAVEVGGDLTVNKLKIAGGRAAASGEFGAGILVNPGGRLTVKHSEIVRNVGGTSVGGGIANLGTSAITDSVISRNSAAQGGGIFSIRGRLTVKKVRFTDNSANSVGGAIGSVLDVTTEVWDSTFARNRAEIGAGIGESEGANTSIVRSTFVDNNSSSIGGAIFLDGQLTMRHVTVVRNHAEERGGGVAVQNATGGSAAVIEDSEISKNTTNGTGGGIFNASVPVVLRDTTVAANQADTGGGIFTQANSTTTLFNTSVVKNIAVTDGGGIFNDPAGVVVLNTATGTVVIKNRPNNCVNVPGCSG
ncbi:right-handed parallel beta-helix repeat-containing protein [Salinispora tropica]|uniref:Polymorphic outer membrane protein n=1 Tax=Salinispora tropica (strain ATCC BAA-916 / DSM 44818 / JCM 13857 / NBRC 105044 / CNB-440) TaxID=369723 RepID=A4XA94_SALTO|nr:right-handed parallel beta-helix repeat-containing protein [Salinispora tropica]ABP55840.1 polymorphic outer membrane protein [Salinispora tropica CNB-440]